jgi:hypothetical protein
MNEAKKEQMRKIIVELRNMVENGPVSAGEVIHPEAMQECLKLRWVAQDGNENYVATELGRAMAGRKDGRT